ncbi:hypothetical protein AX769_15885 [Frondihabitans sp. PAMC 28766]|uniref:hypothetical protein n=1 Tax=Frondihabitans sp. PAMC 28766 TaxID=1795630 RepID=UPI00078D0C8D|nr:hypothetical protein [Frondihabitans sp. PAMC 28766]AMM21337.1 hypothetical protein AX769_15885 [Frondihabitans sp. PAMC 28766]
MSELDEAIERFARPRRHVLAEPEETDEVRGEWVFRALLAETAIALQRRAIEPVTTVLAGRTAAGGITYKSVAGCWPLEIFALTPRGVALPYSMLTQPAPGLVPPPRTDSPVVVVQPTPIVVGDGPGDVEVNRRGQLLWRWNDTSRADVSTQPWTKGFRERFDANWSERRPGPLVEPVAFAVVDHVDARIERGILH